MKTIIKRRFDEGMVNDQRETRSGVCTLSKHFDILTRPHRLTPYRSHEDGSSGGDTDKITQVIYYNAKAFGLGVVTGTSRVKVFEKSDLSNSTWSATTNGADAGGAREESVFVEYKGYGYGWAAGNRVWKADLSGSAAFTGTERSISYTTVAQPLVHSKDDILYMPYDNKIARNNAGTWTDAALTLPTNVIITSISEYGNFVAIGTRSANGTKSRVYLWNRDSSLTTLSESIDWGVGDLYVLEEIEGYLIGISVVGNSTTALTPKIVFRNYSGGSGSQVFKELQASSAAVTLAFKQKVNNRLYFLLSITIDGTLHQGVWMVSRSSPTQPFAVAFDRLPNNDTALSSGVLKGFALIGDYMFISYVTGGAYAMSKTDDQANYTATSIYETTINPDMDEADLTLKKQVVLASLSYVPLPANGQAVLKHKIDGGAFATVFTETTDSQITTEKKMLASGAAFPIGREIVFRIESTGGAEITELKYQYTTIKSLV